MEYSTCGVNVVLVYMLLAMPIICIIAQLKNRYLVVLVTFEMWLYWLAGREGIVSNSIFEALSVMAIGVFIYETTQICDRWIIGVDINILTSIEIVSFMIPLVLSFRNLETNKFFIFCFAVWGALALPGYSRTSNISNCMFNWLGKLSIIIYVIQLTVGELIAFVGKSWDDNIKITTYYVFTAILSIILYNPFFGCHYISTKSAND